ncbi:hypothetical protein AAF712_002486 [Marasmius tenuissimus]|uniref:Uncharacterized protein n=1 Tax=Marasmius tenuissimus TaxID=585030 RepID=A0ABR3AAQ2_9AGAR|nr:hypothetical protein PM082_020646 [Marasmius tenuissimus]
MLSATVSFSVLGSGGWGGVGSLAALGDVEEGLSLGDLFLNGADAFTGSSDDNGDKDVQLDVPMLVLTTPDEDGAVVYDLLGSDEDDEETDYDSESEYDDKDDIDVDDILDCYLEDEEEEEDVSAAGLCDGYDEDADSDEGPILGSKWRAIFGDLDSGDDLKTDKLDNDLKNDNDNLKSDFDNFFNYRLDDYARMYNPDGDSDSDEGPILGCKWRATFGDLDSGDNLHGNFDYRLDDYAEMYDSDCDDSDELDDAPILSDAWRKAFALDD